MWGRYCLTKTAYVCSLEVTIYSRHSVGRQPLVWVHCLSAGAMLLTWRCLTPSWYVVIVVVVVFVVVCDSVFQKHLPFLPERDYVRFGYLRRNSVCLSSVTFVHPAEQVKIFKYISTPFCSLPIHWTPCKILRRSSQGNQSVEDSIQSDISIPQRQQVISAAAVNL